jgi:hypothetical protein
VEGVSASRRVGRALVRPVIVALVAGACTLPARTATDHEADAAAAAADAVSQVGTALLTARAIEREGMPMRTASVLLADAEQATASIRGTFAGIQPPDPSADALRAETLRLIDAAAQVVSRMRIAARRGDAGTIVRLEGRAREALDALDAFATEHGPA